ncbi:hypothetical protein TWF694_000889 [Orbilia ellipsospora]|uniref:Uncharacterized protein n=1 Tax=Orbilia ellipsospora TaxID=2528407 RepID=A0AAV9XQA4_9PEZI
MVVKRSISSPVALATDSTVAAVTVSTTATTTSDEIITLPISKKPRIGFQPPGEFSGPINPDSLLAGATDLRNRLASFLPSLKAADELLEREKLAGRIAERRIEIDSDSEDGSNSDSEDLESDDEDDSEEDDEQDEDGESAPAVKPIAEVLISNLLNPPDGDASRSANGNGSDLPPQLKLKHRKKKNKQPYIEMNLGLGVLEELKPSENDDGDKELDERRELVSRILELRRLQQEANMDDESDSDGSDGDEVEKLIIPEEGKKKVVIEELE